MTNILVVDDQKDVRDFTVSFFRERNFEVYSAENGADALQVIKQKKPEVVLLEIGVEDMSGIGILKSIKKISRTAKVIVVTRVNNMDIMDEAKDLGAIAYLTKPISLSELLDVVLKNIGRERSFFTLKV